VRQEDRLNQQGAQRRAVARRVRERDGVLEQAPDQDPGDAFVDRPERGTDLPGTLAGGLVCCGWKDEHRPDSHQQTAALARPRNDCQVEQPDVAKFGTRRTAFAGRHRDEGEAGSDQLDEREQGELGIRGTISRAISLLVWASVP
jgi:hypothetical protein